MQTAGRIGRLVAVLLLLQMVAGPIVNFMLMGPVTRPPGFLVNAASNAPQLGLAALIGIAMGALSIGIAIAVWPLLRRRDDGLALWLLALALVGCATTAVEQSSAMSMLSLSQAYATANGADSTMFQTVAIAVGAARRWAHYTNLIIAGGFALVFYFALLRHGLVPRLLAAFGMAAAALLLIAVSMPLFGAPMMFALLTPMGLSEMALILWLLARGFTEPPAA